MKDLITSLKSVSQSNKSRKKNLLYQMEILTGKVKPRDDYGISYKEYLDTLSEHDKYYTEMFDLQEEVSRIETNLRNIGSTILLLRGDKWRI